ncbi:OmpH family outer membrane protein [Profundibacter sp.]
MSLRGFILAILFVTGVGWGTPGPAQTVPDPLQEILTIDPERLFADSLFGERVAAEIAENTESLQKEFQKLEADLTAEERDITEKRATMEPADFRKLADAFDARVQEIRRTQDAKARELDHRLEQERARYLNLVLPILGELMNERGAAVILDRRMVFAVASGVDITDEALQRIDATLGDGKTQDAAPQE